MTYEEHARKHLEGNGADPKQATEIIEMAKRDEFLKHIEWNKPVKSEAAFISALNTVATDYLEEKMPEAWFLHRFAGV